MAKYEKPMVIANDELAEGVFAASGCYTVTWNKHQVNQEGRTTLRFQINAAHDASHTCTEQYLTLNFTMPVTYSGSDGTLTYPASSDIETTTIKIKFVKWNNGHDKNGYGDVTVIGDSAADISSASMTDNGQD